MQSIIETAWENRANLEITSDLKTAIEETLQQLDAGRIRVAEKTSSGWHVNTWIKKAVLLSFRLNPNQLQQAQPVPFFDKVSLKSSNWNQEQFLKAGFRSVPGSVVRQGAYIAKNVVLMPSFVNIGAYVDD
jgi:2,3,4,5-tetrahydropyridine-2-carboxylate N-succinyltransferase